MAGRQTILIGRINRLAQKLLSMKGDAVVPDLAPEIYMSIPMFHGTENRYIESWDSFSTANTVAAGGAGFNSIVRMRNPVGSGVVAVLEMVHFESGANSQPAMQFETAAGSLVDLGTAITLAGVNLDKRSRIAPTCILSSQNNAAFNTGNTLWEGRYLANQSLDMIITDIQEVPLLPGAAYTFREVTLNQALQLTLRWRERFLEDSERA